MKVFLKTYGCTANQGHSENIGYMVEKSGAKLTGNSKNCDLVILNTCIVKGPTEEKIIHEVMKVALDKKLIITGCGADYPPFIERVKKIRNDAVFVSSHHTADIVRYMCEWKSNFGKRPENRLLKGKKRINKIVGIVEISKGCLGRCSFCATKIARGNLVSYPPKDIVKEVKNAIHEGCKEIRLTSQDCGCYGLDIKTNVAELVDKIAEIKGDFMVRIGMMNPAFIKPVLKDLVKVYGLEKVYKFAHMPLQSGSDRVLTLMKRGHTAKDFMEITRALRNEIKDVTISTDIIVGFPGEGEEDFEKTLKVVKRVEPDIVNASIFHARKGTPAHRMKNKIDERVKKERMKALQELIEKISVKKNKKWVGRKTRVLVIERGKQKNQWKGKNPYYKEVVVESKKNLLGRWVKVEIVGLGKNHLKGRVLKF